MSDYACTIPTPPSLNALFRNVVGLGRVRTNAYIAWTERAGWTMRETSRVPPSPLTGPLSVSMVVERKDRRRRDIDNVPKAILDLLVVMAVMRDDSQIQSLTVSWSEKTGDETLVEVRKI